MRIVQEDSLEYFKKRVICFDIKNKGLPSRKDIDNLIGFNSIENELSKKYSLGDGNNKRVKSLCDGIKKFISHN